MSMSGVLPPDLIELTPSPSTDRSGSRPPSTGSCSRAAARAARSASRPRRSAGSCRAQEVEWIDHDGHGEVYSFTVIRHAVIPPVADALPLIAAVVELVDTDGCRLVGNVVDAEPEAVEIGRARARLDWYDVREGTTIPVFRLD